MLTIMAVRRVVALVTCASLVAGCVSINSNRTPGPAGHSPTPLPTIAPAPASFNANDPIHEIEHVVIIMQENRSFDSYFGTYPGANGIPTTAGQVPCLRVTPALSTCVSSFHDTSDSEIAGPHGYDDAVQDIDGGKMDGFVNEARVGAGTACQDPFAPTCGAGKDVMGYHDGQEIPNYWSYAQNFVLQDAMFESVKSWSLPSHLYLVSEWSASCSVPNDAASCKSNPADPPGTGQGDPTPDNKSLDYPWTDVTWLLHAFNVSWAYYVAPGTQPDCDDDAETCAPHPQNATTPEIWNPLPYFDDVHDNDQVSNVQDLGNFYTAVGNGTLPAVSWIVPNGEESEHPPAKISVGQSYVTRLINTVMASPLWQHTAIFLAWDDWGGFYDHVVPPTLPDGTGYGLRVPGMVISPYAKAGYIDNQTLSFDAYVKFIEDDFLQGQRLDPTTDGRPDPRPLVRENDPNLGDLRSDFDFSQTPRPPLILPEQPATDLQ